MKHYVIILDWATNDEEGVRICGVCHSLRKAKEIFNRHLAEEKMIANSKGYIIWENRETLFEAGESGRWSEDHTKLYIEEVQGK